MAWRCIRCGVVFEGENKLERYFACGTYCNGGNKEHEWRHFESALDRQNELLAKQVAFLNENASFQNSKSSSSSGIIYNPEYEKKKADKEREKTRIVCDHLGWDSSDHTREMLAKELYDRYSWITRTDPIEDKKKGLVNNKQSHWRVLSWVLLRDKKSKCENRFDSESKLRDLEMFYEIDKTIDDWVFYDYLDSFKESECFKRIEKKAKDDLSAVYRTFVQYRDYFYPKKYCEYLDKIMVRKDGKKKWKDFVHSTNAELYLILCGLSAIAFFIAGVVIYMREGKALFCGLGFVGSLVLGCIVNSKHEK